MGRHILFHPVLSARGGEAASAVLRPHVHWSSPSVSETSEKDENKRDSLG